MASRAALAFSIATFGAIEAFVLSLPVGYLLAAPHAPKSEFSGLAIFGSMLVTGASTAAAIFAGLTILILARYRDEIRPRLMNVLGTLMAAVATAIVAAFLIGKLQGSLLWAIGLSAGVLAAGLVMSFSRTPEAQ